jgi:hypothetical protein
MGFHHTGKPLSKQGPPSCAASGFPVPFPGACIVILYSIFSKKVHIRFCVSKGAPKAQTNRRPLTWLPLNVSLKSSQFLEDGNARNFKR